MAKTLAQIQTLVRFHGRDDNITLTTDPGLSVVNSVYRNVAAALPWPEFRRTADSADSTATGTYLYAWISSTVAVFTDVKSVEIGTTATDATFNLIFPPDTELQWSDAKKTSNTIPVYYQRIYSSSANKIEVRPAPNYSGATIRVTGCVEPTALAAASSSTAFLQSAADDALIHIVAAAYALYSGFNQLATDNIQQATAILQRIFGKEKITAEEVRDIAGGS